MNNRCEWVSSDPLYIDYHDNEWGVPLHDDQRLFEAIILDGFQAGLSWLTILRKRENFRIAFDNFNAQSISNYDQNKIIELLNDAGIIRNKLKINAAVTNARAFLEVKKEFGNFNKYIWKFVGGKMKINQFESLQEIPAKTPESDAMSKDLLNKGFKFVGSTICYAFMQACGMVNDHTINCFRYEEVIKLSDTL